MDEVLSRFGTDLEKKKAYRQYVEEAIRAGQQELPWEELRAGFALGGEEWIKKIGKLLKGNPYEQSGLKQLGKTVDLGRSRKWLPRKKARLGRTLSIEREIGGAMPRFCLRGEGPLGQIANWPIGWEVLTILPSRTLFGESRRK